jgi:MoxR-like ATPase
MATQNPIETEGTYPLPEAQVDRFMMKVLVSYPTDEEEFVIAERVTGVPPVVSAVSSTDELLTMQRKSRSLYVDPALISYAVRLVSATRNPQKAGIKDLNNAIMYGASPRATIGLIEAGRALAFLRGRDYVLPEDVTDVVPDVLRHRVVLSYEAMAEGMSPDHVVQRILQQVSPPDKVLDTHVRIAANA